MNGAADGPILLIGAGRMGGALLKGWLEKGIAPSRIFLQEPAPGDELVKLAANEGITIGNPPSMPKPPALMLLAVKPQLMDAVLAEAAALAGPDTVVLSIAAGRSIESLARYFPQAAPIVRAMPNTPAAIGRGITALWANAAVSTEQAQLCETLLQAGGETIWLAEEAQMDAVTALSGSGPAYVFLLAECMADAGKAAGLDGKLAEQLARVTVSGAGELLRRSDLGMADLRRNVTSPGGTTAAALEILMDEIDGAEKGPLADLMQTAIAAAAKRSRDLAS